MSKLIIFCKHAVETLEYFSRQLAQAFEGWGYEIFWLDFDMLELSVWKLRQAVEGKEAVLLTFNFIGLSGEEALWEPDGNDEEMISFWTRKEIRCLNIIVDHPIYYYEQLRLPAGDMRIFCIDRDHSAYIKRFYPHLSCGFLPTAGNMLPEETSFGEGKPMEPIEQWCERPYPIVFTANYVPVSNIETQLEHLDPEYRAFYYEIMEAFICHPEAELLTLIERYMKREIPEITEKELCTAMHTMCGVDLWIRTYFREKTVRALAEGGLKVYLFGKDWEKMSCTQPRNLISNGRMVNSADCIQAMAQAKIALNTMPWFKDGGHDRIFTSMLQGAAALTDDSRYLREQFQDYDTLVYYNLDSLEELPGQVRKMLQNPEQLYKIAYSGYQAAVRRHTWKQRAETLLRYIS